MIQPTSSVSLEARTGGLDHTPSCFSMLVLVTQSCLTLCSPMDYSPWDFPGKNTGVSSHFLLQGIFLTQGLDPGLPHYRQRLYRLSQQGSC